MSESSDILKARFEVLVKRREDLLADLEWRIPDVAGEEKKLQELHDAAMRGESVDVNVQKTIVDVLGGVLKDKQAELKQVETEILEIGRRLEAAGVIEKPEGS